MTQQISRRRFLKLAAAGVLGAGLPAIGGAAYTTRIEPYMLDITHVTIPVRGLDPAFNGFTIALTSDWHLGAWMTFERMMEIVPLINALEPDVIAVVGDFVSAILPETPGEITRILDALSAREGVLTTLGNHDHWTHANTIRGAIYDSHAWLMWNTDAEFWRGDAVLHIAGVDDIWEQEHDLDEALLEVPSGNTTILLAHEPDYADEAAADGRIALQLSGHSHGGQVRVPGHGALLLPRLGEKYDMGYYTIDGMGLYVTRGLGMIAPYVRFNCAPEVTHITLVVGDEA